MGTTYTEHQGLLHLLRGGTSVVIDCVTAGGPSVLHWGEALATLSPGDLPELRRASILPRATNTVDLPVVVGMVAEASRGWFGTPGIEGSRQGQAFAPRFSHRATTIDDRGTATIARVQLADTYAELALELEISLDDAGVLATTAILTNTGSTRYELDHLHIGLPLPRAATEVLDFTGRHLRERSPQRHSLPFGTHLRASRRGRTGADATVLMVAGEPGFGFEAGRVWGIHLAWSGNHATFAERDPSGIGILGGGELLLPGEGFLNPGESYPTPPLLAGWGNGLDDLSHRLHRHVRARAGHPTSPRKVTLNSWEAVYFDHSHGKIAALAERAAEVGVERFVLDDGWFLGRRDDTAGLGDWYVDPEIWPDGLGTMSSHVRELGMEFGLWVEPEMVNPDSELARAHPDWILTSGAGLPVPARNQQVLNLCAPGASEYLFERLDSLIRENAISYLKWDHNRDLLDPGDATTGLPVVHRQTLAVYRLMERLRAAHPGLEIESCSSGGARVDLGILTQTDRIWTSDCLDPIERQQIQRWTGLLIPPELMGSHVGGPTSHTTGRSHTLAFRAATAFFNHFGIEWDISRATGTELAELSEWVALHKRLRPLLHSGRSYRRALPDGATWLHGVVSPTFEEALYAVVYLGTAVESSPGPVVLPGLLSDRLYRVTPLAAPGALAERGIERAAVWEQAGVELSGQVLGVVGVQASVRFPESVTLFHVMEVGR